MCARAGGRRAVSRERPGERKRSRRGARNSMNARGSGVVGNYRFGGLLARFGQDAALPDVLMALAACERRKDFSRPCGARFTDFGPLSYRCSPAVKARMNCNPT